MSVEGSEVDETTTAQRELEHDSSALLVSRLILEEIINEVTHEKKETEVEKKPAEDKLTVTEWMQSLIPNVDEILPDVGPYTTDVIRGPSGDASDTFRALETGADLPAETEQGPHEIIEPDNPLMVRFQTVLKSHLENQYSKLKDEVVIMEGEVKKREGEKAILGEQLYNEEKDLQTQKQTIAKYQQELAAVANKRTAMEQRLNNQLEDENTTRESFEDCGKEDEYLRKNLEDLSDFVRFLTECKKTQDATIKSTQALGHKNKIEKDLLNEDRQKQDVLLWRLSKEIFRLKYDYALLVDFVKEKQKGIDELKVCVAEADIDLKNLIAENSKITNEVNKSFATLKERNGWAVETRNECKSAVDEINRIQGLIKLHEKLVDKEIEARKKLHGQVEANNGKFKNLQLNISKMNDSKSEILNSLAEMSNLSEITSQDLEEDKRIHKILTGKLDQAKKKTCELMAIRKEIQNKLCAKIREVSLNDGVFSNIHKLIKVQGKENMRQTCDITRVGCQLASQLSKIQESKLELHKEKILLEECQLVAREEEDEVNALKGEYRRKLKKIEEIQKYVKIRENKLKAIKQEQETDAKAATPQKKLAMTENKLNEIEKEVEALIDKWLEAQNRLLEVKEERGKQMLRINVSQKHLLVMGEYDKKNRDKIERINKDQLKNEKEHKVLQQKLSIIEEKAYKQKEYEKKLQGISYEVEKKYIHLLEDAEASSIQCQNEICELELAIEELKEGLTEAQRELLEKEKKFKLAVETKNKVEEEKASTGEVGVLKLQNHRLEVKLTQLKKIEEKLLSDLEMCITKRGMIIDQAEAREKRSAVGKIMTNDKLKKKLTEIHNKCKQSKQKVLEAGDELTRLHEKDEDLKKQEALLTCQVDTMDRVLTDLNDQYDNLTLLKTELFNMIIWKQKTGKYLQSVKEGSYRLLHKTEENIDSVAEHEKEVEKSLEIVINKVICERPQLELPLLEILSNIRPVITPEVMGDFSKIQGEIPLPANEGMIFKRQYCDDDKTSSDSNFGCKCERKK